MPARDGFDEVSTGTAASSKRSNAISLVGATRKGCRGAFSLDASCTETSRNQRRTQVSTTAAARVAESGTIGANNSSSSRSSFTCAAGAAAAKPLCAAEASTQQANVELLEVYDKRTGETCCQTNQQKCPVTRPLAVLALSSTTDLQCCMHLVAANAPVCAVTAVQAYTLMLRQLLWLQLNV